MTCLRPRGFALIEILVVLMVILILVGGYGYFGGSNQGVDQGTADMSLNRANQTACRVSRTAVMSNIQMWETTRRQKPVLHGS